ncbi:MAG: phosphotransferase family protein [Actinomycetota bacterium]|nr:phosphotransferase family protein [Actinomycetota bacterium]
MTNGQPTVDQIVERVSLWRGEDATVSELSGGLTNKNYRVDAAGKRYVLRLPGASTELLAVDRENEWHNAKAAAETGVAPRVLEYLQEVNVMVLEFIEGETMSSEQLRSKEMARRMALSIRRLHSARRFRADFDMFRLTEFYLRVCDERDVRIPEGFQDRVPQVARIEHAFARRPMSSVPCHNDLLAENYIDDGQALRIVDFEYSGNNDPCFELGDTAQECGFDPDLRAALCEAYFGQATPALLARIELQAAMADVGWTLWAAIQAQISAIHYDFWGWATERWERAAAAFDGPGFGALLADAVAG